MSIGLRRSPLSQARENGTPSRAYVIRAHIRAIRSRFKRGSFGWNVWVMLAGSILGQGASVLFSPLLTRIFSPAEFGYLSVYSAALAITVVVASLGLEIAIPIAVSEFELGNLVALCGLMLVGTTGLLALLLSLIPQHVLGLLWLGPLASYRFLLPIGFACLGGYYILVAAATRLSAFQEIARTRISQGLAGPLSQVVLGLLGAGAPGLVIGFVIGQSSGTLLLLSRMILRRAEIMRVIGWRGIRQVWRRYIAFPLIASWSRLLDMAGGGAVIYLMFAAMYSSETAGFLFLCDRVIGRPLLVVSTSVLQVFTGEAGRSVKQDPDMLARRFWQVVVQQFVLTACWIGLANAVAGWVFPVVFGAGWVATVPYLRAISLGYLMLFVIHPVSTTLQMLEHQMLNLGWEIARLAAVMLVVTISWRNGLQPVHALWLYSVAQAAASVVFVALVGVSIRRRQTA